ncbi:MULTISPECIES: hypothetical protein [Pectobacteriaceae]|uniref:Holin n=1 Tax=Dickeya solani TaxID=1089444 RepID=A0ABU4EFD1_9GAMM|nr:MULTISPECIES: hypothetical protein [Pectobacteriaceae]MCA7001648.1 hypothetical protein [Dickeya solani]MCZ0821066.1 hypothetical protein [Dickeya solani]MDV6997441.1 hypothetical protein [Dickeya solani]MDV7003061.1 hypothetical protein [Dickeya solani]MDV7040247.1 hypothetical protein [Dickeya solani]
MNYILERLKEPSTWRGIILFVAGVFGVQLGVDTQALVVSAGVTAAGVVGAALPDKWK